MKEPSKLTLAKSTALYEYLGLFIKRKFSITHPPTAKKPTTTNYVTKSSPPDTSYWTLWDYQ